MLTYLWVAIGGAIGSVARFAISAAVARQSGGAFPWGTLVVNVSGSFTIGIFFAFTNPGGRWFSDGFAARNFLMAGICGGYTTFSAFSLQSLNLMQKGEWLQASANVLLSVALCLVAVWLGNLLGASFNSASK